MARRLTKIEPSATKFTNIELLNNRLNYDF